MQVLSVLGIFRVASGDGAAPAEQNAIVRQAAVIREQIARIEHAFTADQALLFLVGG
ncbi:hypothetical protein D3C86_2110370 [compost metagenome]